MTSRRIVSLLIAALFVLSGCTITLPFQSNPSESVPASTTTYATVEQALHVLVEHQVNKPSSKTLLDGAVSDVAAYLQAQNLTVPGDTPAFARNPVGVEYDPDELVNKFRSGVPVAKLVVRD